MKFLHLADLHLGKRVNGFSMLEDQAHILRQILAILDDEQPDGVLIAGDVYDKSVPSVEAVELLDGFLTELRARGVPVLLISGNHDSPERLAFGGRVMDSCGIHISPVYDGALAPVTLQDAFGPVHVWLLPFVKPAHVRRWFPDADIESYTDAMAEAVAHMDIDTAARNVLVTHQFVTGGTRSGSEELSVGGTDNVDSGVFAPFDYVALGHLHGAQHIGRETIRYAGSPLKYSFSEARQHKSVTVVTLGEKGDVQVRTVALTPLRELREIRGSYDELTARSFYEHTTYRSDYLHLILTDEQDVFDAMSRLRTIYPYLMTLDYDNARTRAAGGMSVPAETERRTPLELFEALYQRQNHRPMSEVQREYIAQLMEQIMEVQG
ncbi:MAG: exonuclease SbcCD subunit D [Oscillospiraceae bacterium]|nr:exonuclease SbcCD subunit D [Oscillospiraceae bacterium]